MPYRARRAPLGATAPTCHARLKAPLSLSQDKKRAFSIQGKTVANGEPAARAFLSVAPALPVLQGVVQGPALGPTLGPAGPRHPRLAKRSHSSVGAVGASCASGSPGAAGGGVGTPAVPERQDDGELQSMHDGRLQVARTVKEKEKNPDRISLDRWVHRTSGSPWSRSSHSDWLAPGAG